MKEGNQDLDKGGTKVDKAVTWRRNSNIKLSENNFRRDIETPKKESNRHFRNKRNNQSNKEQWEACSTETPKQKI